MPRFALRRPSLARCRAAVIVVLAHGVVLSTSLGCAAAASIVLPQATGAHAQARVEVSPTGRDSTCRRGMSALPCATFGRAYALAQGGDVVKVRAGAYGPQEIRPAGAKDGPVTIEPVFGARVTVASMAIMASHVHLVNVVAGGSGEGRGGLDVCDQPCGRGLEDVVIRNFHGKYAFIRASNVTVEGGEFGNFDACLPQNPEDGFRIWGGSGAREPHNIHVVGVTIHDVRAGADDTCGGTPHAGYHVDCMQAQGGVDVTIRDSVFYDCPTSDIQAEPFGGAIERNWLVENNFFGPTSCCNSVVLTQASPGGDCSTFVVRYNVMQQPVNDVYCDGAPLQMYANIFTSNVSACDQHVVESYDVYVRGNTARCRGPGNRRCDPRFVAPRATPPDYRLLASDRCARGAGDPKRFPLRDITGRRRPQGIRPDAGAYEIPVASHSKRKPPKR